VKTKLVNLQTTQNQPRNYLFARVGQKERAVQRADISHCTTSMIL